MADPRSTRGGTEQVPSVLLDNSTRQFALKLLSVASASSWIRNSDFALLVGKLETAVGMSQVNPLKRIPSRRAIC